MLNEEEIKDYFLLVNSHAKKELGQNFLIDEKIRDVIVQELELTDDDKLLEIGPGLGALTEALINKTQKYVAVEYDEKFYKHLNLSYQNSNLCIEKNNILKFKDFDFNKIVGNIPYYISSDIIEFALSKFKKLDAAIFMTQKEFYERLVTKDKREKGPINFLIEYLYDIKKIVNVPKTSFFPQPTVASTIFKFIKKPNIDVDFAVFLYKISIILFTKRRKNIHNNLKSYFSNAEDLNRLFEIIPINKDTRAEDLTLKELIIITEAILKIKGVQL